MSKTNNSNGENDNKRKSSTPRKTSRTASRTPSKSSSRKPKEAAKDKKEATEHPEANKKPITRRSSTRRTPAKRKTPAKAKPREVKLKLKDGETISSLAQKIIAKRKTRQKEAATQKAAARQTTQRTSTKRNIPKRETPEREEASTAKRTVRSKTVTTDHQTTKDNTSHQSSKSSKSSNSSSSSTTRNEQPTFSVRVHQTVAVLIDGNNIEMSIHSMMHSKSAMLDFDKVIPKVLEDRGLNRLIYFREGLNISEKLAERLHKNYHGSVVPCHKSADIPLTITATQIAEKVDTIIIMSGDSDYVELVRHLKSRGVRVEIASVKATTAQILTDEADYSYEITKEDCFVFK